jgi:hypothetical protein
MAVLDGLVVGFDILFKKKGGSKCAKRIFVISNAAAPIADVADLDDVGASIKSSGTKLSLMSPPPPSLTPQRHRLPQPLT